MSIIFTYIIYGSVVGSTSATPFVAQIAIPITYNQSGVKYLSSFDLGNSWTLASDIGVNAYDGTALTDTTSGTETWVIETQGYLNGGAYTALNTQIIYPNYSTSWSYRPFKYKHPRATTLLFGDDGSIYVNGVTGDYFTDLQPYKSYASSTSYIAPTSTSTGLSTSYSWQYARLTQDVTGHGGWASSSVTNASSSVTPLNPISKSLYLASR